VAYLREQQDLWTGEMREIAPLEKSARPRFRRLCALPQVGRYPAAASLALTKS
jgi:hypothetical protein